MSIYSPEWQTLAEAVLLVMASGNDEQASRRQLCAAMSDCWGVRVRATLAEDDLHIPGLVTERVQVPPHLDPADLEWAESRPRGQWPISVTVFQEYGLANGGSNLPRPIAFLELCTEDLHRIWGPNVERDLTSALAVQRQSRRPDHLLPELKAPLSVAGASVALLPQGTKRVRKRVTKEDVESWVRKYGLSMPPGGVVKRDDFIRAIQNAESGLNCDRQTAIDAYRHFLPKEFKLRQGRPPDAQSKHAL